MLHDDSMQGRFEEAIGRYNWVVPRIFLRVCLCRQHAMRRALLRFDPNGPRSIQIKKSEFDLD